LATLGGFFKSQHKYLVNRKKVIFSIIALVSGLLLCIVAVDFLFGTGLIFFRTVSPNYYAIAESRIEIGSERNEVIEVLSDAWYHCADDYSEGTDSPKSYTDYFFYGPQEFDRATVIIVSSEVIQEKAMVSRVLALSELQVSRKQFSATGSILTIEFRSGIRQI